MSEWNRVGGALQIHASWEHFFRLFTEPEKQHIIYL